MRHGPYGCDMARGACSTLPCSVLRYPCPWSVSTPVALCHCRAASPQQELTATAERAAESAPPPTSALGLGWLAPATSAPGLSVPGPHLHRDRAYPAQNTCAGTGLPHLHKDWAENAAAVHAPIRVQPNVFTFNVMLDLLGKVWPTKRSARHAQHDRESDILQRTLCRIHSLYPTQHTPYPCIISHTTFRPVFTQARRTVPT
jgi:hypothetical protein